jgi:hypothetical protein
MLFNLTSIQVSSNNHLINDNTVIIQLIDTANYNIPIPLVIPTDNFHLIDIYENDRENFSSFEFNNNNIIDY